MSCREDFKDEASVLPRKVESQKAFHKKELRQTGPPGPSLVPGTGMPAGTHKPAVNSTQGSLGEAGFGENEGLHSAQDPLHIHLEKSLPVLIRPRQHTTFSCLFVCLFTRLLLNYFTEIQILWPGGQWRVGWGEMGKENKTAWAVDILIGCKAWPCHL